MVIDGKSYDANWEANSLKVKAEIINGDNSGRLQQTYSMYLEYGATFFNASGNILRGNECTDEQWNELFLNLSNPVNAHVVSYPFLNGTMSVKVYVSSVESELIRINKGKNIWNPVISVSFISVDPQWMPNGQLKGYSAYV